MAAGADPATATLASGENPDGTRFSLTEELESSGSIFDVTPHDVTNFATNVRALYVGVAGSVVVVAEDGTSATFVTPAGTRIDVRAQRVNATGTTATNIVGMV